MTSTNETKPETRDALEAILATVESIDRNVEQILDHLADHVAEMRYSGLQDETYCDRDQIE